MKQIEDDESIKMPATLRDSMGQHLLINANKAMIEYEECSKLEAKDSVKSMSNIESSQSLRDSQKSSQFTMKHNSQQIIKEETINSNQSSRKYLNPNLEVPKPTTYA